MQTVVQTKPRRRVSSATAAESKHRKGGFGGYKLEKEQAVRQMDVKERRTLGQLRDAWKRFEYEYGSLKPENYERALKTIEKIDYTAQDVERFSLALVEFQDEEEFSSKAFYFLAALVNTGKDRDYTIHTNHITEKIPRLGYMNTKNITIKGDTGDFLGYDMRSGQIVVEGNVGEWPGTHLRGGRIIIRGDAGDRVGGQMEGGEVHLEGNYISLSHCLHDGKIFHQGVQIYPKPEGAN